ncbi:MAG: acetolactate synthase large subunit [Candidatus Buchananbacteria bacterium]|nr:acetolactate synthase large subunit [Candidatus Buchananbacteria bacterium]
MKASDLLVQALENEGVTHIFGVPGEENLDLIDSLRDSKIKLIVTRHEQAAGFMAATVGRLTGVPGVALSTLGPGATNLITAAAYANLGGMPLFLLTGQKPVKRSKQGKFQMIDTVQIMKPVTKFSKQIVYSESIPALVREAFKKAESERPGAVHLELPEDVAAEKVTEKLFAVTQVRRPVADSKAISLAVEMIKSAKLPLLVIGAAANRKQTAKMLQEFIDKTGIYFIDTQMGKGVIDERHEKYLGTAALSANDYVHCALDRADLIINVGHDIIEKPPFIMAPDKKQKVIHINFFPAEIDQIYFPQLEVVGDIANAVWQIKEQLPSINWNFDYYQKVKTLCAEQMKIASEQKNFPLSPQSIVEQIRQAMPDDGIVALDNGMYKVWFARQYQTYQPNTLLLDNALATMGAGLPSAIAAKIVHPRKKVLAVVGDGGFMMNSQELETAVRLGLNITIVIINDNGFGMIKWKQQAMKFQDFGLSYHNPDFVAYAQSYGASGHRIENNHSLKNTIDQCLNTPGVHVIEVPVDYSYNHKILTEELAKKTCNL